jgi:hypothetical protein
MQKVTVLVLCVVVAGSLNSCAKRADAGGEVPYKPCHCEINDEPLGTIKGETRLFIDELPFGPIDMVYKSYEYDQFVDRAYLIIESNPLFPNIPEGMKALVNICNFPDFAKQWKTSEGINVYYEGIVYPNCEELFGCRAFCYTLILTKLKSK